MNQLEANESVAGGKGTLVLEGVTYLVDPLTDRHFATLTNFIRKRMKSPLESIMESLKGFPPELAKEAVREATKMQASGGAEMTKAYLAEQLSNSKVLGFLTWLLVRSNHPEVSNENLTTMIEKVGVDKVLVDLYEAAQLDKLEKN